jgi:hypothetical protein
MKGQYWMRINIRGYSLFCLMFGRATIKPGNPDFFKMGVRSGWNYYT